MWRDLRTRYSLHCGLPERSSNFQYHQGTIIGRRRALRKPIHFSKHAVRQIRGIQLMLLLDQFANALSSKELPFAVGRLGDAIGMKYHDVAGLQRHTPLVVARFLKNPQRKSSQFHLPASPILIEQRLRLPSVGHPHLTSPLLPRREANGHEAAFDS